MKFNFIVKSLDRLIEKAPNMSQQEIKEALIFLLSASKRQVEHLLEELEEAAKEKEELLEELELANRKIKEYEQGGNQK